MASSILISQWQRSYQMQVHEFDSDLAMAMMSINAVKGVEIGAGMHAASLTGETNADEMRSGNEGPRFLSNNNGGILGGISSGQPIVARFSVKPTSSILTTRKSVTHSGEDVDVMTRRPQTPTQRTNRRMTGRVFTANYDTSDVAIKVWIPLGVSAILGTGGLIMGQPLFSLLAAALTFISLRSWPLTRTDRPALTLSDDGVEIDGLGMVHWQDIQDVNSGVVEVKGEKRPAIDLAFRRSISEIFEATEATRLRPWEIRIFKLRRDGKMRLDLSRLDDAPDEILEAFRYFNSGLG